MRKAVCAVLFFATCPILIAQQVPFLFAQQASFQGAQQGLNNDSIIKMVSAQLSDDVIISTVNASPGAYDTSPDGLIALKQAGVSDKVIAALVAKSAPAAPSTPDASAPSAPLPPGVENIGAYYKDSGGNWQPLPSEVVIFQSGGLVKHVASAGLMKEDLNGLVGGMRSRLVVSTPITFILHVPQGRAASDYELVRLHVSGNNRQFQSVAGGLMHESTSGSIRDEIDFSAPKSPPVPTRSSSTTDWAMASSVSSSRRTRRRPKTRPATAKSSPLPSSTKTILISPATKQAGPPAINSNARR